MIENYKPLDKNKRYLITGVAGFIGFHLAKRLLAEDCFVIGLDNLNDYYDVNLKKDRLSIIKQYNKFKFYYADLQDKQALEKIFKENKIEKFIILPEEKSKKCQKIQERKLKKNLIEI